MEPENTETRSANWQNRSDPAWITRLMVEVIHTDQLRQHGGKVGLRDAAMLESALARPQNKWVYETDGDSATLAAAYGFGITKNHPFLDGNKRTALMVIYTFLGLNHQELDVPEADAVLTMRALAAGEVGEEALSTWVRKNVSPT